MGAGAVIGAVIAGTTYAAGSTFFGATMLASAITGASLGRVFDRPKSASPTYSFGELDNTRGQRMAVPVTYGRVKAAGNIIYHRISDNEKELFLVIGLGEGEIDGVEDIRVNGEPITSIKGYKEHVVRLGTENQPAVSWVQTGETWPNTAYLACKFKASEDLSMTPTITCVVRGRRIRSWSSSQWVTQYSNNPAWCILDLLTNERYGVGIKERYIDLESFKAEALYCDELVDDGKGGQEPRFRLDYNVDFQRSSLDLIDEILSTFRAYILYSDGKLRLQIEKSQMPVQAFTMDNIVADSFSYSKASLKEIPNRIRVEWIDPESDWEQADITYDNEVDQEERGDVEEMAVALYGVTRPGQAGREARWFHDSWYMCNTFCEFRVGIDSLHCEAGDVIKVSHDVPGWVEKQFRILEIQEEENDEMVLRCREYNSAIYHDRGSVYTQGRAPELPNPNRQPSAVTNLMVVETSKQLKDGTWIPQALVSWEAPDDILYRAAHIYHSSDKGVSWQYIQRVVDVTSYLMDVPLGENRFRIVSEGNKGIVGDIGTSPVVTITIVGKDTPPPNVVWGECSFITRIELNWNPVIAHDLQAYEVRIDQNWGNQAGLIYQGLGLSHVIEQPTRRNYTFYIKALDRSGNYSNQATPITLSLPAPAAPDQPHVLASFRALQITTEPLNSSSVIGYTLYVTEGSNTIEIPAVAGQPVLYTADPNTTVTIQVAARDIIGEGPKSEPLQSTTVGLSGLDTPPGGWEMDDLSPVVVGEINLAKTTAGEALAGLGNLDERVDGAFAEIGGAKDRLTTAETELGGVVTRLTDAEGGLSGALAGLVDLQSEVEGIEIGGRNLAQRKDIMNWPGVTQGEDEDGKYYQYTSSSLLGIPNLFPGITFLPNTQYTLSFRAKKVSGLNPRFVINYTDGTSETLFYNNTTIKTYIRTSQQNKTISRISHDYGSSGSNRLYQIQIEKGNKATDWTPAPEDTDAKFTAVDATLLEHEDWIEARATKTEVRALEGDVATVSQQVGALEVSYAGISGQVNTISGTVDTLTGEISGVSSQVGALELRADGFDVSISDIGEIVDGYGTTLTNQQAQIQANTTAISLKANNSAVTALGNDVSAVQNQVGTLEVSVGGISGQVSNMAGTIDDMTGEISGITDQVGSLELRADGFDASISEVLQTVDGHTTTLGDHQTQISQNATNIGLRATKAELQQAESGLTTLIDDVSELIVGPGGVVASVSSLNARMGDAEDELTTLSNAVFEVLPGQISAKADVTVVEGLNTRISSAEQDISALGGAITTTVTELSTLRDVAAILKPEGAKLWHFDTSLDSTDGIKPLDGAVATLRPGEGRFGGAVAVEEGTTNYALNGNFATGDWTGWGLYGGGGGSLRQIVDGGYNGKHCARIYHPVGGSVVGIRSGYRMPVVQGDLVSFQYKYKGDKPNYVYGMRQGESNFTFAGIDTPLANGWTLVTYTWTSDFDGNLEFMISRNTPGESFVDEVQYEKKPFATSFVDGVRGGSGGIHQSKDLVSWDAFTISGWTRIDGLASQRHVIVEANHGSHQGNRFLFMPNNSGQRYFYIMIGDDAGSAQSRAGEFAFTDGEWFHWAITFDGNSYKAYFDGALDIVYNQSRKVVLTEAATLRFGGGGSWGILNGLIDELLILPYAATDEEIKSWYEAKGPFVDQSEINYQHHRTSQIEQKALSIEQTIQDLDQDLSGQISLVDQRVGGVSQLVATLDQGVAAKFAEIDLGLGNLTTTIGDNESGLISQVTQLSDRWGVTVDINGNVSGINLLGDTGEGSVFSVLADRFRVANPVTGAQESVFVVEGGDTYVRGKLVVHGLLRASEAELDLLKASELFADVAVFDEANILDLTAREIVGGNGAFELSPNRLTINTKQFKLDEEGNAEFTGTGTFGGRIEAEEGYFRGAVEAEAIILPVKPY